MQNRAARNTEFAEDGRKARRRFRIHQQRRREAFS